MSRRLDLLVFRHGADCGTVVARLVQDDDDLRIVTRSRDAVWDGGLEVGTGGKVLGPDGIRFRSRWADHEIIVHPAIVAARGAAEESWLLRWPCPGCRSTIAVRPLSQQFLSQLEIAETKGTVRTITVDTDESD